MSIAEREVQQNGDTNRFMRNKIRQKFDEFFIKRYREKNQPEFRIVHSESKKQLGISHTTYMRGLEYLQKLGLITVKSINSRKSLITMKEVYLRELGLFVEPEIAVEKETSSDKVEAVADSKNETPKNNLTEETRSQADSLEDVNQKVRILEEEMDLLKKTIKSQRLMIDVLERRVERFEEK